MEIITIKNNNLSIREEKKEEKYSRASYMC